MEIQIPMAQGRSTQFISISEWIRTSRLSIKNSLFGRVHNLQSRGDLVLRNVDSLLREGLFSVHFNLTRIAMGQTNRLIPWVTSPLQGKLAPDGGSLLEPFQRFTILQVTCRSRGGYTDWVKRETCHVDSLLREGLLSVQSSYTSILGDV